MTADTEKSDKLNQLVECVNASRDGISSIRNVTSGLLRIISDPDSSAKELKELIEIDPPLTGKILRMANSAYYAPTRRIGEIGQAIVTIGFNAVKELALTQKVCEVFEKEDRFSGYSRPLLWKHTVAVALLGKFLCRRELGERGEDAYAAGILHDLGIIVEDQFLQDDFRLILRRAVIEERNLHTVERRVLGFTHADIGRAMARDWNLPSGLSLALGFHHRPHKATRKSAKRAAAVLHLAEGLAVRSGIGCPDAPRPDQAVFDWCVEHLGLDPSGFDLLVEETRQEVARMESQGLLT